MKPAQRFQLKCRRASEAASRLGDWLDHNSVLLGLSQGAVQDDLTGFSQRLFELARAADSPPAIGLVSTDAGTKFELLAGLTAANGQFAIAELGPRPLDTGTLYRLLPHGDGAGGLAAIRFSAGEPAPSPRGYPLKVVLLGLTDLAAVITKAWSNALHGLEPPPEARDVDAVFADVSTRLSSQAIPGLSNGDVAGLGETLNTLLPGNLTLAKLGATRYWTTFREIAAHISDSDRLLVFSLLWGRDKTFSALFERMAQGLAKFGHGGGAYCSAEALIGKDVSTGWITHHSRSILHAATLFDLAHPGGAMISAMNRFGQAVEIERAVLAGLIAELPLHCAGGHLAGLAPAEIIDLPVPLVIGGPVAVAEKGTPANDDLSACIAHFARAKAIYLVEQACLSHRLTCLVAAADPAAGDDTFAPAIGDWVDHAQGASAQTRRHVRCGLFVVAPLAEGTDTRVEIAGAPARPSTRHELGDLAEARATWPDEWTPGRPFTGLYRLTQSRVHMPEPAKRSSGGMALSMAASPSVSANQQVIDELAAALKPASEPAVRQVQLNQAFLGVRRRLNDCVIRHHHSNAPYALADWRRGAALVLEDRIKFLQEGRRLGHLVRALLPRESELLTAIDAHAASGAVPVQVEASRWPPPTGGLLQSATNAPVLTEGDPAAAQRMADRAIAFWFRAMRRSARSGRLNRSLGIEERTLQNLVDELQLGAIRTGLPSEIAQVFRSSGGELRANPADDAKRLAALAHRMISAFLELSWANGGAAADRTLKGAGLDAEVADPRTGQYSYGGGHVRAVSRHSARKSFDTWDRGFARLLEDNISSAHVVSGRSEKDRELGELIQLFASGPFEVEL